jgi:hypothetical protein
MMISSVNSRWVKAASGRIAFVRCGEYFVHEIPYSESNVRAVMNFRGRELPEPGRLAGYAWLIERHNLRVALPHRLCAVAERHHPVSTADWRMMLPRQMPAETTAANLIFAIRNEGLDLSVLERLTHTVDDQEIAQVVKGASGLYARRLWFIWEWLSDRRLPIPDLGKVTYAPLLDPEVYVALSEGEKSSRHKVIDNLPGTRAFCPLVRRSAALDDLLKQDLAARARRIVEDAPADLISRAAAFMLLNDSKASFAIERERPGPGRATRWARAIAEAGVRDISIAELERLQQIVIEDTRFVGMGLRRKGGFIGRHERDTQAPLPVHISARHQDLVDLMTGLQAFERRAIERGLDPVVAAALLAFGFVYIHPFEDGNGRLHRYLIHHILARAGFNPPGIVFPVSAAIHRRIETYAQVLESISAPRLDLVDWKPTKDGNVEVLNDTAHLYRFFDMTKHAEFLAECVQETIEVDLPKEIAFLRAFDRFKAGVDEIVDMPGPVLDLLLRFLSQNRGRLSKRAREKEFRALTEVEIETIELLYALSWPEAT